MLFLFYLNLQPDNPQVKKFRQEKDASWHVPHFGSNNALLLSPVCKKFKHHNLKIHTV